MEGFVTLGNCERGFQVGQNRGTINIEAPAKERPYALSTVPFCADRNNIHRKALHDEVHRRLSMPAARVALVGLGGAGYVWLKVKLARANGYPSKSQLAIEYAHTLIGHSPGTWVLWFHASSATRLAQSVRTHLDVLKVPGRSRPLANVFQLLRDWLYDARNGRWLIILDNLDDARFLLENPSTAGKTKTTFWEFKKARKAPKGERYIDYLPTCAHGSILVTSRSRAAALHVVDEMDLVSVGLMDEQQAVELLEKKLIRQHSREQLVRIAKALNFIPLAMAQAASYINQRGPRCSAAQYFEQFGKNEHSKTSLLNHDGGQLRRHKGAASSIIVTWQISFEHIHAVRPSAAKLLCLMSMLDPHAIPETLLHTARRLWNKTVFEDDLAMLQGFSFISTNDGTTFEMHSLVQFATQKWLKSRGKLELWQTRFLDGLVDALPSPHLDNWHPWQQMLPHINVALSLVNPKAIKHQTSLLRISARWILLIHTAYRPRAGTRAVESKSADCVLACGEVSQDDINYATRLCERVLSASSKLLGTRHPDTLHCMTLLGCSYMAHGRYVWAKQALKQALDLSADVLGKDHVGTLRTKDYLAQLYRTQKKSDANDVALKLETELTESWRRIFREKYKRTADSTATGQRTEWAKSRWEEVSALGAEALSRTARLSSAASAEDEDLEVVDMLAKAYAHQGRDKEAGILRDALESSQACSRQDGDPGLKETAQDGNGRKDTGDAEHEDAGSERKKVRSQGALPTSHDDELTFEEQLAISLCLSEVGGSAMGATALQRPSQEQEVGLKAAVKGEKAKNADEHSKPKKSGRPKGKITAGEMLGTTTDLASQEVVVDEATKQWEKRMRRLKDVEVMLNRSALLMKIAEAAAKVESCAEENIVAPGQDNDMKIEGQGSDEVEDEERRQREARRARRHRRQEREREREREREVSKLPPNS
ncbi:hypothetical protein LTR17_009825 [Elasticomyces elasticus]|nr:hypothetical protein LTR17_009825 [Elasticomyces elasticus]